MTAPASSPSCIDPRYGRRSIYLEDLDGDGDDDLVKRAAIRGTIPFLRRRARQVRLHRIDIAHPNTVDGDVADLDCDGDMDLVLASTSGTAPRAYFNVGNGFMLPGTQSIGTADAHWVTLGDFDDDADVDLVKGDVNGGGSVEVWWNDGTGFFIGPCRPFQWLSSPVSPRPTSMPTAISTSSCRTRTSVGGPNLVYLNNGFGQFADSGLTLGSDRTQVVALDDLDEDGTPDIISGNKAPGPLRVWLND